MIARLSSVGKWSTHRVRENGNELRLDWEMLFCPHCVQPFSIHPTTPSPSPSPSPLTQPQGGASLGNEECEDETDGVRPYGCSVMEHAMKELESVGATGKYCAKAIKDDEEKYKTMTTIFCNMRLDAPKPLSSDSSPCSGSSQVSAPAPHSLHRYCSPRRIDRQVRLTPDLLQ